MNAARDAQKTCPACLDRRRGFTLIELLVVVAIIGLLISILLPSLQRAREQAKLVSCAANSKQIGTTLHVYQAEYNGYVPVMWNYDAHGNDYPPPADRAVARVCSLSVAFRDYSNPARALLSAKVDATNKPNPFYYDSVWKRNEPTLRAYENKYMPQYYVCPFERGRGPREVRYIGIKGKFALSETHGRYEAYHTWRFEGLKAGEVTYKWPVPTDDPLDGVVKYPILCWWRKGFRDPVQPALWDCTSPRAYRQWKFGKAPGAVSASASTAAVLYCSQGEHLLVNPGGGRVAMENQGSHKKGRRGGTNVIFADSHVEWVKGSRLNYQ